MIKKGDLVMVTRLTKCCGNGHEDIGEIFVVNGFEPPEICYYCKAAHGENVVTGASWESGIRVSRLTKIDPPAIPEQILEEAVA